VPTLRAYSVTQIARLKKVPTELLNYLNTSVPPGDVIFVGYSMGGLIAKATVAHDAILKESATCANNTWHSESRISLLTNRRTRHLFVAWERNER